MGRQLAITHSITDRARAFAEAFVNDPETAGNASASALKAGYAERSAGQEGHRLLRHDGVRSEINRLTCAALGDHAAAAVQLLGRVVRDEKAPLGVRVDAAKTILDRAGHIAPKAAEPITVAEKAIAAMTIVELERRLAEEEEKDEAVIDITPDAVGGEETAESDPPAAS